MTLSGAGMFYLTWALQIILAVKFISSAFIHAFRQDKPTLQYGIQKMGAKSKPILAVISALLAIDAVMLVLPRALGWDPRLTVYAAALGALLMLGSIVFHLKCRETPKVWVSMVLLIVTILLLILQLHQV
jgi:peptidoglycan/LPS O-acetylase OafA/YrhL